MLRNLKIVTNGHSSIHAPQSTHSMKKKCEFQKRFFPCQNAGICEECPIYQCSIWDLMYISGFFPFQLIKLTQLDQMITYLHGYYTIWRGIGKNKYGDLGKNCWYYICESSHQNIQFGGFNQNWDYSFITMTELKLDILQLKIEITVQKVWWKVVWNFLILSL